MKQLPAMSARIEAGTPGELRDTLRLNPRRAGAWNTLVRWHLRLGQFDEALAAAQEWLVAVPGSAPAHWHLARLHVRSERYEQAREHIDAALADATAAIDPGLETAKVCCRAGRWELAEEIARRLLAAPQRVEPQHAEAVVYVARVLARKRKAAAAETCYRAAAAYRRRDPGFLAAHGKLLLARGEVEEARVLLERSVYLAPGADGARLPLALTYLHRGDAELGRAYLAEAVGIQEEGRVLAQLFGGAAPLVEHFGADIDRFLAPADAPRTR
jgi:tetratricopeptide (TPR) repeat protein